MSAVPETRFPPGKIQRAGTCPSQGMHSIHLLAPDPRYDWMMIETFGNFMYTTNWNFMLGQSISCNLLQQK